MSQTLTLEISDGAYKVLSEIAQQEGKTPAEMGAQWLALAIEQIKNDPLEPFIGALHSDVPDWADRHDQYLGEALIKDMSAEKDGREAGG